MIAAFDVAAFDDQAFDATQAVMRLAASPFAIMAISSLAGDFAVNHGLGRMPAAALPLSNGSIQLEAYDDYQVFLNAEEDGIPGILVIW